MDVIRQLEQEEIKRLGKEIPAFAPGDTVVVNVNVKEGDRKRGGRRLQAYEGVVIAKRNRGLNSSFTVRKLSSGEGVERTFQTYSPLIASVEVKRKGDVRRAKLYYLRDRSGKGARIREKLGQAGRRDGGRRRVVAAEVTEEGRSGALFLLADALEGDLGVRRGPHDRRYLVNSPTSRSRNASQRATWSSAMNSFGLCACSIEPGPQMIDGMPACWKRPASAA